MIKDESRVNPRDVSITAELYLCKRAGINLQKWRGCAPPTLLKWKKAGEMPLRLYPQDGNCL